MMAPATAAVPVSEIGRVGKFGIVGAINTVIDFTILNILHTLVGMGIIEANLISTTVAMVFSFTVNRKYVFTDHETSVWRQGSTFLMVTAVGLYGLQTVIIHLLTVTWTGPLGLAVKAVQALGLGGVLSASIVITNGAKAIATIATLTWNYLLYKRVVFV